MADIEALLAQLYHPGLKTIEPGLERVVRFLDLLGAPQRALPPVIHVAGTNGKGSLVAYLSAIFKAAGIRAHSYTSPHLVRFNERIVLDGEPITDDALAHWIEHIVPFIDRQPVTFFEATTAIAFLAFAHAPADVILLETGMGGRLDATNVIDQPALTAITPVSLDHCDFLGHTLTEVATEKAGIIKPNVPCVVGRQLPEAAAVFNATAERLHAPLYRMNHEWQVAGGATYQSPVRTLALAPSLAGSHQLENAATAVACIDRLPFADIPDSIIKQGLAQAVWPARLQRLTTGRYAAMLPAGMELWLDGGHNPQGGEMLGQWFAQRAMPDIHLICGMVQGKDSQAYLKPLAPYLASMQCVAIAGEPQSQSAQSLQAAANAVGIAATVAADVEKALQTATSHAKTPAIICISGSLYLAGKVLAANG